MEAKVITTVLLTSDEVEFLEFFLELLEAVPSKQAASAKIENVRLECLKTAQLFNSHL